MCNNCQLTQSRKQEAEENIFAYIQSKRRSLSVHTCNVARRVRLSDTKHRPSTSGPCPSGGSWCCTEAVSVSDTPQTNPYRCEASPLSAKTQSCASSVAQEIDAASRDDAESRDDYWRRPLTTVVSGCRVRKCCFVAPNLLRTTHLRRLPSHRLQDTLTHVIEMHVIVRWMPKGFRFISFWRTSQFPALAL